MFKKYRIRYDQQGYYVIQKRVLLFWYKDLEYWVRNKGLDDVYITNLYKEPPLGKLAELLKYG